jgi:hypothetical protein
MEFVSKSLQPGEKAEHYALMGAANAQRGRTLFNTGATLLALTLGYLGFTSNVEETLHLYLGLLIFILALLPGLLWARTGGGRFPVFETMMLLCANTYALPLLKGHELLATYPGAVITKAGMTVLLYQISAFVCYQFVSGPPGRAAFWRESLINNQLEKVMIYGLTLSTFYVWVSAFTEWIPAEMNSVLRAVFFGIGIICTFVGTQRWGRGELTAAEKSAFFVNLAVQLILMSISLILIGTISLIGIAILGYITGGKRIPWLVLILAFLFLAILHGGKTRMREKYWEGKLPQPTTGQLAGYYTEWIGYGLDNIEHPEEKASSTLLDRTSLMHILCLIINYTPERQDYLHGSTYRHVLPQLVPRFFWPEKPRSHIATYELSIYYGLQNEESTETTTIAFGLLSEAYANFGMLGALVLGAVWGVVLKKFQIWTTFSPLFSFGGLFMVLLLAWSLNTEMTMAVWLSSFQQAVVVVLGLPLLLRGLFGF